MMYKRLLLCTLLLLVYAQGQAMCGAMISFDEILIVNESSRVIMVRDGNHTIVTMTNDFKGAMQNFAMVVPVPEVLSRNDIRVIRPAIFARLDNLTAPYLETLYDPEPNCPQDDGEDFASEGLDEVMVTATKVKEVTTTGSVDHKLKVKVNARYQVEEYDIVILSAKDSDGLQQWLALNGYNLPPGSTEALKPYIESGMKFFVVKVNLSHPNANHFTNLRPLQIQFDSPKFMLPIRLGMANAVAAQDMVVYAFTKSGRVETTNYQTRNIPTNREIPHIFSNNGHFDSFYKAVFDKAWRETGQDDVFLEYASVLNGGNIASPDQLNLAELKEAGVWWLNPARGTSYTGDLHLTRLHVRYTRDKFPQDLSFMQTPNKTSFQSKYVVRIPAQGPFNCARGQSYLDDLQVRFRNEVAELASLTGWNGNSYQFYLESVPGRVVHTGKPFPILEIVKPVASKQPKPPKQKPKIQAVHAPESKDDTIKAEEAEIVPEEPEMAVSDDSTTSSSPIMREEPKVVAPTQQDQAAPENADHTLLLASLLLAFSVLILGLVLFRRQRKNQH